MTVNDFLSMREATIQAELKKALLDTAELESFRENVTKEFHSRYRGPIEDTRDAYIAVGAKPNTLR